jgi:hypothetical protein
MYLASPTEKNQFIIHKASGNLILEIIKILIDKTQITYGEN